MWRSVQKYYDRKVQLQKYLKTDEIIPFDHKGIYNISTKLASLFASVLIISEKPN